MTLNAVIKQITKNYEFAKETKYIKKPISWSLYQAWKWCDAYEKPRNVKGSVPNDDEYFNWENELLNG